MWNCSTCSREAVGQIYCHCWCSSSVYCCCTGGHSCINRGRGEGVSELGLGEGGGRE